jgi:type VI secretion system secreted protein VgrG
MHTLAIDGLERLLRVVRFSGYEAISRAYEIEITAVADDHDRPLGSLVGRPASLSIDTGGVPRPVHGIVSRVGHGHPTGEARAAYDVTLVPALWRTRLRTDSRIFQDQTVPQILADVLERSGLLPVDQRAWERRGRIAASGYRMALANTYRSREYCVQYRESDWDFLHRLMEEEGIHYVCEHDESSHVVLISDVPTRDDPLSGDDVLPFRPAAGALATGDHVCRFRFAEEARPARVVVSDYSFERPRLPLAAAAQAGDDAAGEVFEHPGRYDLPDAGRALAQVRLEELQASRWTGEGVASSLRLVPGRTFVLTDHPSPDLNRRYLVTRVDFRWAEGAPEAEPCRFEVIPADVAFRPPRRTPKPLLHGPQTAIVVGRSGKDSGEEINTDTYGRIKVRFHWDRSDRDDGCSGWVRVAQASAGAGWGTLFLPRVGHEVVVTFLEGDPDRPLVTGSVYHATNVPPYALPAGKTKSTLKTSSYPDGGGSNELSFEDQKGAEEVYLHAQRDLSVKVEHNRTEHVDNDETTTIGANRTTHVTGFDTEDVLLAQTVTVGAAQAITVGAAQITTVGGFMSLNVGLFKNELVGAASAETVMGRKTTNVGFSYSAFARTGVTVRSGRNASFLAAGHMTEEAGKDMTLTAAHKLSATSGADMSLFSGHKVTVTAEDQVGIEAHGGMSVVVDGYFKERASKTWTMTSYERVTIRCADQKSARSGNNSGMKGTEITIDKSGNVTITGAGKIKIKGSAVDING